MPVNAKFSQDDKLLIISIDGKFDFNLLNEFRDSYTDFPGAAEAFVVDLRNTVTIDSSALGMLLNMKRHLKLPDGKIKIINCNETVSKVLHITSFNKKFAIE